METQIYVPCISVIMSVKNGANYLNYSIDSIINQTFSDWEFIICDDGSSDNTLEILYKYANQDKRFKVLHNDLSQGLAFSLNRCIEAASSNILARQDADDTSDPRRFEIQYPFMMAHPEYAIVGTCWYNVSADGSIGKNPVKEEPTAKDQIKGGLYMHPSWMMRKNQLELVGFYTVNKHTIRSQDYHLVMKILGSGMKLYNMQEYLYYYTADRNTMRRSRNWKRVKGQIWIRWDAYKRNKLPFWSYVYAFKPLITNILPQWLMDWHYKRRFGYK